MSTPVKYPPMSPYLTVKDASKAIAFYQAAFGATELFRLTDAGTGTIGHAEIMINGSHFMLADENPAWGSKSPLTLGGTAVKLCLMVKNIDSAVARASAAGATVEMPPSDMFYGFRCAAIRDPFGHQWLIQHEIEKVSPQEMQKRWDAMVKLGTTGCPATDK
ncbi:MAG: VOC family protein [Verrucomicrobiales bacterium]|nr:VOC family protein [Verrucomicrobiales bacterium]